MMNIASRIAYTPRWSHWRGCLAAVALAVLGSGCQKQEIQVYTAPKDPPPAISTAVEGSDSRGTHSTVAKARPQVTWNLPENWRETGPGQLSLASFTVSGADNQSAQVTITPLARLAGRDTEIVNMWREQVGLEPLSREEAARQFQPVQIGGESGSLFEIGGAPTEGAIQMKIVTAVVHRSDASWFYKLSGDAAVVESTKPVFIEFLKSIQIKEAAGSGESATAADSKPNWRVPQQWKELPAGEMQFAKFAVPERSGAKAEVFVSVFPNDTGGALMNVNRWRKQIGLAEVPQNELNRLVSPLDPAQPDAILVDMTNSSKRLLGAIVPRGGRYWFYKLLGDAAAVTPEKEAFVAFVRTQP
jgi:hypothetical protein